MNAEKDPASRPRGMKDYYKSECLKVVRAWIHDLGGNRETSEENAITVCYRALSYPTPRRVERIIETLTQMRIVEFFDAFDVRDESTWNNRGRKMRLLEIPIEITTEIAE